MSNDYSKDKEESEAFAKDMGFGFYILWGTVYEYRGWKSEKREATEEKLIMWKQLGGPG